MSNEGYMNKARVEKGSSGQSGPALSLRYEDLNKNEKAVVGCLKLADQPLSISQIVLVLGWERPCKVKGNSRVRNSLRRLVRSSLIDRLKSGTYALAGTAEIEVEPTGPSPRPITENELFDLRADPKSSKIKNTDCTFYNACLDQAISGKWDGFACTSCNAYAEADPFQKECDQVRLAAVQKAAELVEKYGKVHRVRGVKPGADAKRTVRLKVVETVSLAEAFANID